MSQAPQSSNKDPDCLLDVSRYRPFLRELDMDVFDMLGVGLITKAALDTDMNTKVEDVAREFSYNGPF